MLRRAHEGDVEVDVALQHLAAIVDDATGRVPDHDLHHICTTGRPYSALLPGGGEKPHSTMCRACICITATQAMYCKAMTELALTRAVVCQFEGQPCMRRPSPVAMTTALPTPGVYMFQAISTAEPSSKRHAWCWVFFFGVSSLSLTNTAERQQTHSATLLLAAFKRPCQAQGKLQACILQLS